jgi:hypothetical protein
MDDAGKPLFPLDEGLDGTTSQRLNRGSNYTDRQSRVAGTGCRGQLDGHRRIDRRSAVNSVSNQVGQGLTQPVRHFFCDVAQSIVDGGGQGQAGKRSVICVILFGLPASPLERSAHRYADQTLSSSLRCLTY